MPRTDWSQSWLEYHKLEDKCSRTWCRLHFWPVFKEGSVSYPMFDVPVLSSRFGWQHVAVFCGPGTFRMQTPRAALADKRFKDEQSGIIDYWD